MTKDTYLKKLKDSLSPMPEAEREEALSFYKEYFEDAENDEEAIKTLGSAGKLGAQIVAQYSADYLQEKATKKLEEPVEEKPVKEISVKELNPVAPTGMLEGGMVNPYTRTGYIAVSQPTPAVVPIAAPDGAVAPNGYAGAKPNNSVKAIWYVIIGIFALPVALPVAIVAIAVIAAILAVCIALVVALVAIVIALCVACVGSLIYGASNIALGGGAVLLSVGGAVFALGLLFLLLPLIIKAIVWLVGAVGKLISKIFNKLKKGDEKNEQKDN